MKQIETEIGQIYIKISALENDKNSSDEFNIIGLRTRLEDLFRDYATIKVLFSQICNLFGHDGEKNGKYYECMVCGKMIHETNYDDYKNYDCYSLPQKLFSLKNLV